MGMAENANISELHLTKNFSNDDKCRHIEAKATPEMQITPKALLIYKAILKPRLTYAAVICGRRVEKRRLGRR